MLCDGAGEKDPIKRYGSGSRERCEGLSCTVTMLTHGGSGTFREGMMRDILQQILKCWSPEWMDGLVPSSTPLVL